MPEGIQPIISSEVRQRLLEAALDIFSRKGYEATSVRELVEAAGVTKPVLYYYFKNKEGLYLELIRTALAEFHKTAEQLRKKPGSAREKIKNYCMELLDLFASKLQVARLIFSIYYGPPQGAPHVDFDESFTNILRDMKILFDSGIDSGEIKPGNSENMAWIIVSVLNTAMEEQLCNSDRPRIDRNKLGCIIDQLFKGILI